MAWSIIYRYTPFQFLELALLMVLRDFVCVGVVVATILWYVNILLPMT